METFGKLEMSQCTVQVTVLGSLRSGRELLMSKAEDAEVTVAGIALAMAVPQRIVTGERRCKTDPSHCRVKGSLADVYKILQVQQKIF